MKNLRDFVGQKFSTEGDGGKSAWEIVGTMANDNLELAPIKFNKTLSYRPALADRIGMFYGKWHMPAPKAFGKFVW